jgi:hypothetical protein
VASKPSGETELPPKRSEQAADSDSHGYGSDASGFNELSKEYKKNPSIENYLKLRRDHPDGEIEVSILGGIEQLEYMEAELERFGIDAMLFAGLLDADRGAISEVALILLEKLVERDRELKKGKTHLARRGEAIPDKLVDWIIGCALDALSWNDDLHIPRDLIVLIRERLTGSSPEYERASNANQMRLDAEILGGQLLAQGVQPTFRLMGQLLDVEASTVKRWFPEGDFLERAKIHARGFDETGQMRPFSELGRAPGGGEEEREP